MLILTRKAGESIFIGDDIKITVLDSKGSQARIGVEAPPQFKIYREEIYLQILEENKIAAQTSSEHGKDLSILDKYIQDDKADKKASEHNLKSSSLVVRKKN